MDLFEQALQAVARRECLFLAVNRRESSFVQYALAARETLCQDLGLLVQYQNSGKTPIHFYQKEHVQ
jgi:hypothetical protein